ncbi:MAG: type II toxin-antitoxin system RelE/ParE family toxin [Marinomonas foliarum]|uniref:type II toxin-antitoxin system RelE/ParE family toxin n=1 Tax=Marinomonas foliarum TaxID=491950 RepID=UPI003F951C8D
MIYKTKEFCSLTKKDRLSDMDLIEACDEIQRGLVDADLGGALYKKRVATEGKGKSGGYRTIIGAVIGEKYFFLYAFAKNKRANITKKEQMALRELAQIFISFSQVELENLIVSQELIKVEHCQEGDRHE